MRIIVVIIVWVVIVGGLSLFMSSQDKSAGESSFTIHDAEDTYSLEIVTTFAVETDPFALQTDDTDKPVALLVKVNGETVLKIEEDMESGESIVVDDISGLIVGRNEFYIEANPPLELSNVSHAIRLRVLKEQEILAEKSLWSEPGLKIADTLVLEIKEEMERGGHGHD